MEEAERWRDGGLDDTLFRPNGEFGNFRGRHLFEIILALARERGEGCSSCTARWDSRYFDGDCDGYVWVCCLCFLTKDSVDGFGIMIYTQGSYGWICQCGSSAARKLE